MTASADERPNVLLLLTDQERYDLTAPGELPVATPNLDRLQDSGMRFERAYTPISICTSARASLLTGLYPHRHGMLNNSHEADAIRRNLPPELLTFGESLADAGYRNTYVGKWHVDQDQGPEAFGFSYFGGSDDHHDDLDDRFENYRREVGVEVGENDLDDRIYTAGDDPTLVAATTPAPPEATRPYFLAERTIDALSCHADDEEPFFHRTDFLGPHHPYVVPEPYASMYDPDEIDPWPSYAETFDGKPTVHENYVSYRGVADFDWETWAEVIAKYWGFMTFIDEQIGRILDAVDDFGLADDTAVFHASDHGDFVGNHRQFNKGPLMYEDTYRVPLQVRWPGVVDSGSTCDEFVGLQDLMPTFIDLGGGAIPDVDGRSIRPLLAGERPEDWPATVFCEYHGDEFGLYSQRMVRTDRYKFVYNGPGRNELYDLDRDPDELRNLVDHPAYRGMRRDLAARLIDRMEATHDPLGGWVPKALDV